MTERHRRNQQAALKRHWLWEPEGYRAAGNYISGGQVLGRSSAPHVDALERIAESVMPRGFTAYVSKPDIPTYFVGQPELVARFHELVPSPNDTYCNLFWPLDTEAADKLVKERKAEDTAAKRARPVTRTRRL